VPRSAASRRSGSRTSTGFALIPDRVIYLDVDVEHLVPRVLATSGFDYWESGQDFLRGHDMFQNFVTYQRLLLAEFRRPRRTLRVRRRRRARCGGRHLP
jgi:hypothetical protein